MAHVLCWLLQRCVLEREWYGFGPDPPLEQWADLVLVFVVSAISAGRYLQRQPMFRQYRSLINDLIEIVFIFSACLSLVRAVLVLIRAIVGDRALWLPLEWGPLAALSLWIGGIVIFIVFVSWPYDAAPWILFAFVVCGGILQMVLWYMLS
jgi:hypothetical protein